LVLLLENNYDLEKINGLLIKILFQKYCMDKSLTAQYKNYPITMYYFYKYNKNTKNGHNKT